MTRRHTQENTKEFTKYGLVVPLILAGLAAVYLSRYFTSWPAQLAGGIFLWMLLTLLGALGFGAIAVWKWGYPSETSEDVSTERDQA